MNITKTGWALGSDLAKPLPRNAVGGKSLSEEGTSGMNR